MEIVKGTIKDLKPFWNSLFNYEQQFLNGNEFIDYNFDKKAEFLKEIFNLKIFIAQKGNEKLGCIVGYSDKNEFRLDTLFVYEEHRKNHIASKLLNYLIKYAFFESKIVVSVLKGNDLAYKFYTNRGFKLNHTLSTHFSYQLELNL